MTENSTIKPLSTTSVPCMKIQGGTAPAADAHAPMFTASLKVKAYSLKPNIKLGHNIQKALLSKNNTHSKCCCYRCHFKKLHSQNTMSEIKFTFYCVIFF